MAQHGFCVCGTTQLLRVCMDGMQAWPLFKAGTAPIIVDVCPPDQMDQVVKVAELCWFVWHAMFMKVQCG